MLKQEAVLFKLFYILQNEKVYKSVLKTFKQMKKTIIYLITAILLISSAYAACYDSDDGPKNLNTPARYLGIDGFVTKGNTTYYDSCVTRNNGVEINSSNWVREYYCDNDEVKYRDYFCPTYYYVECLTVHKAAACDDYSGPSDYNETSVNASSTNNTTNTTNSSNNSSGSSESNNSSNATITPDTCGNDKVDLGEDCDPPGKNCYTSAFQEGICDFSCLCDSSMTRDMFNRLNQTINEDKEEQDEDNSSVIAFSMNNSEESDVNSGANAFSENKTPEITGAFVADPIDDLIKEAKKPPENFEDSWGIKFTSAVTSVVMLGWNLLISLIGG